MKKIWQFFSSVKTAIFIFFMLSLSSIIGTLIKQQPTPEGYEEIYGPGIARLIKFFQLYDLYHSWWFQLLITLFTINLIICSIERLPTVLNFFKKEAKIKDLSFSENLQVKETILINTKDLERVKETVKIVLSKYGFPPKIVSETYIFSEKGIINRLGVYFVHFSILIVLLGGLVGSIFGFTGNLFLVEGGTSRNVVLRNGNTYIMPFDVKCHDFKVEYYENKPEIPKEYISDVEIIENGRSILKERIRVNHPLSYKGIRFYQASYGIASINNGTVTIRIKEKNNPEKNEIVTIPINGEATSKTFNLKIKALSFLPDLVLTESGPTTRSMEMNNPAILIEVEGNETKERVWVFQFFPTLHQNPNSPYEYEYVGAEPLFFTVLQVSKDPGTNIVWLGCILMIVSIYITFFMSHKRIFAWINVERDKVKLTIGGTTNRNKETFTNKVNLIINEIKNSLRG